MRHTWVGVWRVFDISYSSDDAELATALATDPASNGYLVWRDIEVEGGVPFREAIARMLDKSHTVIVLWTSNSVRSGWVQEEADEAREHNKLVPVKVEELDVREIPFGFRHLQTIELHDRISLIRILRARQVPRSLAETLHRLDD